MNVQTSPQSTQERAWSWLKSMSPALYSLDQKPLRGYPPAFPWEKLSQAFASSLGLVDCKITGKELVWKEDEAITEGFGERFFCMQIAVSPIVGSLWLLIGHSDVEKLFSYTLQLPLTVTTEQSSEMIDAFCQFFSVETLCLIQQIEFDKRLSFKISSYEQRPTLNQALALDIALSCSAGTVSCRLLMNKEFIASWAAFFSTPQKALPLLDQIPVTLRLQAGRTQLPLATLLEVRPGDFLVCDHMFFSPDDEKSRLFVVLDEKPLFRAKLKAGSLKILDIPLYSEVYDSMVDKIKPVGPVQGVPQGLPLKYPKEERDDPFADFADDEFEDDEELTSIPEEEIEAPLETAEKPGEQKPLAPSPLSGAITAQDIPVTISIELAQIQMSAQKVIELQPGNVIDLEVAPENGVTLVVGGKIIGRGEILKIGDTLGVRVLEIGV